MRETFCRERVTERETRVRESKSHETVEPTVKQRDACRELLDERERLRERERARERESEREREKERERKRGERERERDRETTLHLRRERSKDRIGKNQAEKNYPDNFPVCWLRSHLSWVFHGNLPQKICDTTSPMFIMGNLFPSWGINELEFSRQNQKFSSSYP